MKSHSLTIIGSGIKSVSHMTVEAIGCIENSDVVFYLVNEPILAEWIQQKNHAAQSLNFLYDVHDRRKNNYQGISQFIIDQSQQHTSTCLVLYGHPTVYSEISGHISQALDRISCQLSIQPAISAEDCLYADLLVDPGACGHQSYEATDMLVYQRPISPYSHLTVWQVGMIGALGNIQQHDNYKGQLLLQDYLLKSYPEEHSVTIYEAAQYPHFSPRIESILLKNLATTALSPISTLYIPPAQKADKNTFVLKALGIRL